MAEELPDLDKDAQQRIETADLETAKIQEDVRLELDQMLKDARRKNRGYVELDIGGVRFADHLPYKRLGISLDSR